MDEWIQKVSEKASGKNPDAVLAGHSSGGGGLSWVPWRWVNFRYGSAVGKELNSMLKAYLLLHEILDLDSVAGQTRLRCEEDACRRCGRCCAELTPDPVTRDTFRSWKEKGNPIYLFYGPVRAGPLAGRFYSGWYCEGVRLRMCPLMLRHRADGDMFCAVYHLGPGHRPPACEEFRANWPHCEVSQRPLVP